MKLSKIAEVQVSDTTGFEKNYFS